MRQNYPSYSLAFAFLCLTVLFSGRVVGQGTINLSAQLGIPVDQFATNLNGGTAFGIGAAYLQRIGESPLSLGLGTNLICYNSKTWNEYWAIGESVVDAEYNVESSIFDMEARARFEPPVCLPVQPYGEAFAGVSSIGTTLTVTDLANSDDCTNTIYGDRLSQDWTHNYGAGFGLLVPIGGNVKSAGAFIDLAAVYRNSGQAEYIGREIDDVFVSRTNMWMLRLGITLKYN